jgi:hypothetical protein
MDKDYIRINRYLEDVWAEEMRKHPLEALVWNIKSDTRFRDGINTSATCVVRDNN